MQTFFTIVKILWNKGSWKGLKWKIGPFMLPWVLISPLVVRFTWYANKLHVANSLSDPSENVNGHLFLYSLKTFIMSSLSGMIEAMTKFHHEFLKQKEKSPRTKKKRYIPWKFLKILKFCQKSERIHGLKSFSELARLL